MTLPTIDIMYDALVQKDSSFEGIFIVGVKTTGIFCRPTCSARKPKKSNTEYFTSVDEAQNKGYRACKICRPLEREGALPAWLQPLFRSIESGAGRKLSNDKLKGDGMDPTRVRRWFKKNYGMTFQQFQRRLLANSARAGLQNGEGVTQVAFEHGYESLSGFGHTMKKTMGVAPKLSEQLQVILTKRILTPLGPMIAASTGDGLCLLEFADRSNLERQIRGLEAGLHAKVLPGSDNILIQVEQQLEAYFKNEIENFNLSMHWVGNPIPKKCFGRHCSNSLWQHTIMSCTGQSSKKRKSGTGSGISQRSQSNCDRGSLPSCHWIQWITDRICRGNMAKKVAART